MVPFYKLGFFSGAADESTMANVRGAIWMCFLLVCTAVCARANTLFLRNVTQSQTLVIEFLNEFS